MEWERRRPLPEGIPPYLALRRIGLAGSPKRRGRWALTPPFHVSPRTENVNVNGEERSPLCGAFRTLTGPALPRYPALRRPDFPPSAIEIADGGCPILRP